MWAWPNMMKIGPNWANPPFLFTLMWTWPIRAENEPYVETPTPAPTLVSLFTHLPVRVWCRAANSALTIATVGQFGVVPTTTDGTTTAAGSYVTTIVVVPLCPTSSSSCDSSTAATIPSTPLLTRNNGVATVFATISTIWYLSRHRGLLLHSRPHAIGPTMTQQNL